MRKIITFPIDCFRRCRHFFATLVLKHLTVKCGDKVGAARIPRISRCAKVEVGHNCSFNGMTISGWGEVKIGNYFHSGENVKIMLGSHDYDHDEKIPYGNKHTHREVVIDDYVWVGSDG